MSKHTPGPWKIVNRWLTDVTELQTIAIFPTVTETDIAISGEPQEFSKTHKVGDIWNPANARLIAAAPEMWEMLRKAGKLLASISDVCMAEQESPVCERSSVLWDADDEKQFQEIKNYVEYLSDEI